MIENSPQIDNLLGKSITLMNNPEIKALVDEINETYLYWSDVKYKKCPSNVDIAPIELWACVKFSRMLKELVVWKKYNISFSLTNNMQCLCHYFDMNFGGSWGNNSLIPTKSKEQYLINSLMEEAISSSQMEGASTTRNTPTKCLQVTFSANHRIAEGCPLVMITATRSLSAARYMTTAPFLTL